MKGGKEDTDIGLTMRQDKAAKKKGYEAKETRKRKRDELTYKTAATISGRATDRWSLSFEGDQCYTQFDSCTVLFLHVTYRKMAHIQIGCYR